jgi:kynureninase
MLDHPDFKRVVAEAWARGVVPDFRPPQGLRVGLSPLSTSFTEVAEGLWTVRTLLG